jgi:hypothetical protein
MEHTSVIDDFHRFSQLQTSVYFADFPSKHTEKKQRMVHRLELDLAISTTKIHKPVYYDL